MAGQQIYIEETIRAMKKAIAREDNASDSDESIIQRTNRGNKLKRKAKYVQEGKLNNPNGPQAYKRKIEHHGYVREIISRNPVRFDEDGDEIEDDEISDSAEINKDDPYSGIIIEELLGPLTSVADLPKHPSLSIPYTSRAIADLAQNAAETLRRESATLWRMKQTFAKLRGDEIWAPCGIFETEDDRKLFSQAHGTSAGQALSSRSANLLGSIRKDPVVSSPRHDHTIVSTTANQSLVNGTDLKDGVQGEDSATKGAMHTNGSMEVQDDNLQLAQENHDRLPDSSLVTKSDAYNVLQGQTNQVSKGEIWRKAPSISAALGNGEVPAAAIHDVDEELLEATAEDEGGEEATTSSEPLSHRMTTRAQAKAPLSKDPSTSPTISLDTWIHPIFSVPASALPDKDFGLPAPEADETRKLLMLYVQKQEEVIRGTKILYDGLLRANRMKNDVFKWSKAEGHLGEMSDGEDWYDKKEWGLDADLVKGREEDDDETNLPGKKTRQRRQ